MHIHIIWDVSSVQESVRDIHVHMHGTCQACRRVCAACMYIFIYVYMYIHVLTTWNILQDMLPLRCPLEHCTHVGRPGHVPLRDVTIEFAIDIVCFRSSAEVSFGERRTQVGHIKDIPGLYRSMRTLRAVVGQFHTLSNPGQKLCLRLWSPSCSGVLYWGLQKW